MAEVAKIVWNSLGLSVFIMGILANLNNWISILLASIGVIYGLAKAMTAWEIYFEKRDTRISKKKKPGQE